MTRWIEERLHKSWKASLKTSQVIHEVKTDLQDLIIFENEDFGRVMMLDHIVQLSSKDEFIYHEMLSHMAMFAHGQAKHVLIVGGGDGGVLREVLRHSSVERVVLCEIDRAVIDLSLKYFPEISDGAFDHPKAETIIADGCAYVRDHKQMFDVILIDSTDPIGPAAALFTKSFYADCEAALKEGGLLVAQNGLPFLQPDEIKQTTQFYRDIGFDDVSAYWSVTPSYFGGPMAFAWGALDQTYRSLPLSELVNRFEAAGFGTKYYTPQMHQGAFALPPYIGDLVHPTV